MSRIIVIGGGIAGLSVAARLACEADVTVLEAEDALGYHTSSRSAAVYEENYGAAPVVALNKASKDFYFESDYLSPRGLMLLCRDGEDAAFEADLATLDCHEIPMEAAKERVPILAPHVTRAGYHAEAYDIDTDRLLQDFAGTVRKSGGQIVTNARVSDVHFDGQTWTVNAGGVSHQADKVVNAAGAWADDVARMAQVAPLGLTPLRRSMARLPAPEGLDTRKWPIFFGSGESWYAKPDAGGLIVSPAEEDPHVPADVWADDLVIAEGLDRYAGFVRTPVTRVETTWAGLRSFTADRVLALGPDAELPSFIWCAGQGGYGFATAPAASQLTADLTLNRTSRLDPTTIAALSAARFAKRADMSSEGALE